MKYEIQIDGVRHSVELEVSDLGSFNFQIDDRTVAADVAEIDSDAYSILINGRSFEARVARDAAEPTFIVRCSGRDYRIQVKDPRAWRAGQRRALEAAGSQRVLAPMPGRIVRVLVAAGESVEAGKGLVVVEAMKMQNEIRAPKSGIVERILVTEGQAVRTQEALVIIS